MRLPSDNLIKLLSELQLATAQDIAACEPSVRRLCQDLPEFDSVWIDALVQQHTLTPWQAGVLQSSVPNSLRVSDYLKREQLGPHTFHAVSVASGRHVVLQKSSTAHDAWLSSEVDKLEAARPTVPETLELARGIVRGRVADDRLSHDSGEGTDHSESYIVSSFVPGWTVHELLIRGGRIPWPAVSEIGRQLLQALSWLERRQLVHGDLCLQNVRLTPDSQTVLVSSLVSPAARQGLSLTARLRLKDVETIAPERVGTGAAADSRSELYAVGCILWQLLTARPPFLSADPVNKVLKSQETDVPDVRGLVPDCPDWMARLIHSFTRRSPELRPSSLNEAADKWNQHCAAGTHATRRLLRRMPDRSMRRMPAARRSSSRRSRAASFLTAILMIAVFAGYGVHRGLLPTPLTVGGSAPVATPSRERTESISPLISNSVVNAEGLLQMPEPDPAGVVLLQSGKTYAAQDLKFAGVMHIETTDEGMAVVETAFPHPWRLTAGQVLLSNVQVQTADRAAVVHDPTVSAVTVVACESDVLSVKRCIIESGIGTNQDRGLRWTPRTGTTSVISISDCVFSGSGYGLSMSTPPERCSLHNLLVTSRRAAIRCEVDSGTKSTVRMSVSRVTHVGGVSFLDAVLSDAKPQELLIQIQCGESVLAVSTGLVQIAGPTDWPLSRVRVECLLPEQGNPTIVPPDVPTAIGFDSSLNAVIALQPTQVRAEALLIAQPSFRGESKIASRSSRFAAFELLDYEGPKLSPRLPGVDVAELPQPQATM